MTQPEPAQPRHTVDTELRHLRIAQAGHDLALQAACRKTEEQQQRAEQAEAAIGRIRALHAEGHDGRCESCGVRWPCLNICRLNTPPGCRNCEEWHTPAAVLDQHGQTPKETT